jgi:hypothetical protein
MKKLAALLGLSALLLASAASAQSTPPDPANKSFQASYSVTARNMNVGDFNLSFSQTGQAYQVNAQRRLTGFARMLARDTQDFTYSVNGVVGADGQLHPGAYQHRGGKRNRLVRATFSANDIVTVTDPPNMSMGHPPATQAQKRGAIDQLSAIAAMVTTSGNPCSQTLHIYLDGRSRFDFAMQPNGQVAVNSGAYRGQALRCRVQFTPIAGFSDPQDPAVLTFLFAPTPSGMFAPVQIEMPSDDAGIIRLDAQRITVNGQRLR